MSTEFKSVGPNSVISTKGFSVKFHAQGGVDYADASGVIRVDTELLVRPLKLRLYRESVSLKGMTDSRANEILVDIQRALDYLGHPSEISEPYW